MKVFLLVNYLEKKHTNKQNKTKRKARVLSTDRSNQFRPRYITVTSLQTSRESLLSFKKFRYLDVPKLDEIMVYHDFECNLMGR